METIDIEALRKAAEAATAGPWHITKYCNVMAPNEDVIVSTDTSSEDRAYIATANPSVILALLDRLERAEARVIELDKASDIAIELQNKAQSDAERAERMFMAACTDLGAINEELGLDPDDGGADPIIEAIKEIRAQAAAGAVPEVIAHLEQLSDTPTIEEREAYAYARGWNSCRAKVLAATPPAQDAGTGELRERIAEAWANYERMGEICSFEGEPMIYASTLREIAELARRTE